MMPKQKLSSIMGPRQVDALLTDIYGSTADLVAEAIRLIPNFPSLELPPGTKFTSLDYGVSIFQQGVAAASVGAGAGWWQPGTPTDVVHMHVERLIELGFGDTPELAEVEGNYGSKWTATIGPCKLWANPDRDATDVDFGLVEHDIDDVDARIEPLMGLHGAAPFIGRKGELAGISVRHYLNTSYLDVEHRYVETDRREIERTFPGRAEKHGWSLDYMGGEDESIFEMTTSEGVAASVRHHEFQPNNVLGAPGFTAEWINFVIG